MITIVQSPTDLQQILQLQKSNLPANLTPEEIASQGFVTVSHTLTDLQKMDAIEHSVIAKENDQVVAYLLAMTIHSQADIPILIPMFELFNDITYQGKRINDYKYIVVGQVCVAQGYRGRGILDSAYAEYKKQFSNKYSFAITEISLKNQRSLKAHARIGFKTIHEYVAPNGEPWSIVLWNWE